MTMPVVLAQDIIISLYCRDDLREHLKDAQKLIMAQKQVVSSSDSSSESSSEEESSSSSSEEERRRYEFSMAILLR